MRMTCIKDPDGPFCQLDHKHSGPCEPYPDFYQLEEHKVHIPIDQYIEETIEPPKPPPPKPNRKARRKAAARLKSENRHYARQDAKHRSRPI